MNRKQTKFCIYCKRKLNYKEYGEWDMCLKCEDDMYEAQMAATEEAKERGEFGD